MSSDLRFGAGIWHFATYVDRYATDGYGPPRGLIEMIDMAGRVEDLSVVDINYPFADPTVTLGDVEAALERNGLSVIGITPEIYTRRFAKGAFTNPDSGVRRLANEMVNNAADVVRRFGASYVKLWPGQDGWDYPFQVDHRKLWQASMDGIAELAEQNGDLRFVIEYKPREPRVHMSYDSMARTLLGIGIRSGRASSHRASLYGGESPADAARSPSTTAACSAWTSTTTSAAGTTTSWRVRCTRSNCSSFSTRCAERLERRMAARPVPVSGGRRCRRRQHDRISEDHR